MAVDSFMPVTDVKISTEKEARKKPSLAELTTIETPGKPVSAAFIAKQTKKQSKNKKPAKKKENFEEEDYEDKTIKKDSILIITEKPQAALKIASALGHARKYSEDNVPYYEVERNGKKIIVASAVGHLFGLNYKLGQKGWPIFDLEWVPSYEKKSAAFTKRYYSLLKRLTKRAKEFIVATDFDNEGEVIGWNVLRFICKQKNAKRMKFSTLTTEELEKSFDNPLPNLAWEHAYAGEARHYVDWMYGINLSRALMSAIKRTGSFRILSIGRVQGPALKIIVDREREIEKFKSEPYWQVFARVGEHLFKHPEDIFDKSALTKFQNIKEAMAETKKSEENIQPPVPFDLTTLQTEAYKHLRMSPSETLKVAQQLYIDGLISYPRTSSQKIPSSIEPKKILKRLKEYFPIAKEATRANPIEGKKSDPAHPSIYPTGEYGNLGEREEKLYMLIVKRFISAFSPDALTHNKRITLTALENGKENKNIKFTASALKLVEKGWTKVYPVKIEEIDIPDMNGKVKIDEIKIEEKETQPPKRYTPASLISTLEKKGLGTKATRSTIIETLFERGYLDGKSIQATQLGLGLIGALEKHSPIIIDENLTRNLEEQMEKIQESKDKFEEQEQSVIDKAKKNIIDISKEFKSKELEIGQELAKGLEVLRKEQQEANTLIECPTCKKGKLRILFNRASRRSFVACSAYPECKQTYSLPPNALIKKSDKICESCNFPKVLAIRKGKRPWELCFNTNCEVNKRLREEWEARKAAKAEK